MLETGVLEDIALELGVCDEGDDEDGVVELEELCSRELVSWVIDEGMSSELTWDILDGVAEETFEVDIPQDKRTKLNKTMEAKTLLFINKLLLF